MNFYYNIYIIQTVALLLGIGFYCIAANYHGKILKTPFFFNSPLFI
jgi:hypothetical protein